MQRTSNSCVTLRRRVVLVSSILVACIAIYTFSIFRVFDTLSRRRATHREVAELVHAAKKNPTDPKYPKKLIAIAQGNYSFGATNATAAIGEIGESAHLVIHELAKLMYSKDPFVAREAALSLSRLGPISRDAFDDVIAVAEKGDADDDTTWFAIEALGKMGNSNERVFRVLHQRVGQNDMLDSAIDRALQDLE